MVMRRSAIALGVAAVLLSGLNAFAQKDQARKLSDVEKKEQSASTQAVARASSTRRRSLHRRIG